MENETDSFYGIYSKKAADLCGHLIYLDEHGKQVAVTSIVRDPNNHGQGWDDIVCVGRVVKLIAQRTGGIGNDLAEYWREENE